jgi:hypothetical protein
MIFLVFINMGKILFEWFIIVMFVILYVFFIVNTDFSPFTDMLVGLIIYSVLKIKFGNNDE